MKDKQAKYPQLRFKGFTDPWVQRELSDIAEVRTGKAFSSSDFTDDGEFRVVTNKNIQDKTTGKIFTGDRINVSDQTVIDKYVLSGENILVTMDGANIGKVGMYTDSGALLAQRVGRLNSAVLNFVYQIVSDEKFISRMNQLAVGNAIKHISLEQIGRYEIAVPESETEKTKIGQLLSNLDNLIAANQRKLDLLKEQKKGYLQKMFPKKGEVVPELRFPGFTDAWEQRKLGEISKTTIGEFVIKNKQDSDAPYPVYNGGTSYTGFYDEFNNEGDKIVISARGANAGFVNYIGSRFWAGNSCYSIDILDKRKFSVEFMYQFLKRNQHLFTDYQQAANIPSVSKKDVATFIVKFPTPNEQCKIGSFFKQLDHLITLHQRKLKHLQLQKKGLLQQMFC